MDIKTISKELEFTPITDTLTGVLSKDYDIDEERTSALKQKYKLEEKQ